MIAKPKCDPNQWYRKCAVDLTDYEAHASVQKGPRKVATIEIAGRERILVPTRVASGAEITLAIDAQEYRGGN